jgi:glyoxylase-like metal-dependent hydrolase (beta-lactamase superfamily II)
VRIHHINCATMCPFGGSLFGSPGGLFSEATLVCHCLVIETSDGLVLVDTGLGTEDVAHAGDRLGTPFLLGVRPRLDPEECAVRQIERLGFTANDVRHIVVTHLDVDHAGGLPDFPNATVHLHETEHAAAMRPLTFRERERYRAVQWAHGPKWKTHGGLAEGESWFGFDAVRALSDDTQSRTDRCEVLIVPLFGHTRGHSGIAVRTDEGWLLHAGDAYFFEGEMSADPTCPAGLAAFQRLFAIHNTTRLANQARLRELVRDHASEVRVFCAHSPSELDRLGAGKRAGQRAGRRAA